MNSATLTRAPARSAVLLVRGAHVVDPAERIDALHDVLVRDGEIAAIGAPGELDAPDEAEAAAIALSTQRDVVEQDDVSYDPSHGLYGLAGEDEAVRVTTVA